MRRGRNAGLVLFWAAVVLLAALSVFFIATREVVYTPLRLFNGTTVSAEVERHGEAVSAFTPSGEEDDGEPTEEDVAEIAGRHGLTEERAREMLEEDRPFGPGDYEARAAVLRSAEELRSFGGYYGTSPVAGLGRSGSEPDPAFAAYGDAFFAGHDLLVGQVPVGSVSEAGYELAGVCVQDGVAVMYARRVPDPWGMATLDQMWRQTFAAELPKEPGGYSGVRIVSANLVVTPGSDGACELAFLDRGGPCAGMAVEGALADAGARLGDWPDDPAATFSAVLDGSGRVSVRGMRPGETWRVRVLSGGSPRAAGTVAVAPHGFDAGGEVVFSKEAV